MKPTIIFFGSFGSYSATVLEQLLLDQELSMVHIVTSAPFTNRKGKLEKSPVQILAEKHNLPVTTQMPNSFEEIAPSFKADYLITAGYGHLLPAPLLNSPTKKAINLHFSVLPKYRGANPGEWAILMGEKESGISIIEMNEKFDEGGVLFSVSIPISQTETRESLYEKLYLLGGQNLPLIIKKVDQGLLKPQPQTDNNYPFASRFKREDGFVDWQAIKKTQNGESAELELASEKLQTVATHAGMTKLTPQYLERATRALFNFPSLWTIIPTTKGEKRMKIHSATVASNKLVLESVQIEGQTANKWNLVKNQAI